VKLRGVFVFTRFGLEAERGACGSVAVGGCCVEDFYLVDALWRNGIGSLFYLLDSCTLCTAKMNWGSFVETLCDYMYSSTYGIIMFIAAAHD